MVICSSRTWSRGDHLFELVPIQPIPVLDDSARVRVHLEHVDVGAKQVAVVPCLDIGQRSCDDICGADQAINRRDANSPLPHPHHVVGNVALSRAFVLSQVGHNLLAQGGLEVADTDTRFQRDLEDLADAQVCFGFAARTDCRSAQPANAPESYSTRVGLISCIQGKA